MSDAKTIERFAQAFITDLRLRLENVKRRLDIEYTRRITAENQVSDLRELNEKEKVRVNVLLTRIDGLAEDLNTERQRIEDLEDSVR